MRKFFHGGVGKNQAAICCRRQDLDTHNHPRKNGYNFLVFIEGCKLINPMKNENITWNFNKVIPNGNFLLYVQTTAYTNHLTGNITADV
jgi:hypothetical protein